jgi:Ca2+-binding RTX toxin-like protein
VLQMGAFGATPDFRAIGVSVSGAAFGAAAWTATTDDDLALYRLMLAGNDYVLLSAADDVFDAGDGKDLVLDQSGNNRINAGLGDDVTRSGTGHDTVSGGRGDDVLIDDGGTNRMNGGGGGDVIGTGAGQDTLTGGAGGDVFVFRAGRDVVTDFAVGHDHILLISSALALSDVTLVQSGANTRITVDDITVVLRNVDAVALTATDFAFNDLSRLEDALTSFLTGWDVIA